MQLEAAADEKKRGTRTEKAPGGEESVNFD